MRPRAAAWRPSRRLGDEVAQVDVAAAVAVRLESVRASSGTSSTGVMTTCRSPPQHAKTPERSGRRPGRRGYAWRARSGRRWRHQADPRVSVLQPATGSGVSGASCPPLLSSRRAGASISATTPRGGRPAPFALSGVTDRAFTSPASAATRVPCRFGDQRWWPRRASESRSNSARRSGTPRCRLGTNGQTCAAGPRCGEPIDSWRDQKVKRCRRSVVWLGAGFPVFAGNVAVWTARTLRRFMTRGASGWLRFCWISLVR
jgi:hypothetical protein